MRDPARVRRITLLIQDIWEKHPDLRYFEVISWLEQKYSKQHYKFDHENGKRVNLFDLEDSHLEKFLKEMSSR